MRRLWPHSAQGAGQRRKNSTSETRWRLLRPMTAFEWAIPQRLSARSAFTGPMPGKARSRSRTIAVCAHAGGSLSTSGNPTRPARRSRFSCAREQRTSFAWASACNRRSGIHVEQVARGSCTRHRSRLYASPARPPSADRGTFPNTVPPRRARQENSRQKRQSLGRAPAIAAGRALLRLEARAHDLVATDRAFSVGHPLGILRGASHSDASSIPNQAAMRAA